MAGRTIEAHVHTMNRQAVRDAVVSFAEKARNDAGGSLFTVVANVEDDGYGGFTITFIKPQRSK